MYIFIIYSAVTLSEPVKLIQLKNKSEWKSGMILALTLVLFFMVVVSKWKTVGRWG